MPVTCLVVLTFLKTLISQKKGAILRTHLVELESLTMKMPQLLPGCSIFLLSVSIWVNSLSLLHWHTGVSSAATSTFGNETDRLALLAFKKYLIDDGPSGPLSSWNVSLPFCQWQGVTCGRKHQRVTALTLVGQGLAGSLPPSIGNLTFLREVNFCGNKLYGTIPKEIGRLSRLQYLNLSENHLHGRIPVDLTNCSNLDTIDLSSNNHSGNIPHEVGSLSKLLVLWLPGNKLAGAIPSSIGNLTSLKFLALLDNNMEGSIPHNLGGLQDLLRLRLSGNNLSGTIPSALYNLSSIVEFSVAGNHLSGDLLPNKDLISLPSLRSLVLGYNQFTGSISASLSNISRLQTFDAPSNSLSGQVSNNLGVLDLDRFNIEFNGFGNGKSGDLSFLTSLTNASNLRLLGLKSNRFGGQLPNSIANFSTQLTRLTLGNNEISGSIPEGIGNLINLVQIGLEQNHLNDAIPTSFGKLQKLEILDVNTNRLSGHIPSSLGNLTRLFFLSVATNNLEGGIPLSLKKCNNMQSLFLGENKLSGSVPENFLSHFDQLIYLYLYQNSFTGSFPRDVGNLKNLGELYIAKNKFSSEIPRELGECLMLEYVSLANNSFQGNIPTSLGLLKAMRFLDLSHNNLSGRIPQNLQELSVLLSLDLSFNQFEGDVPTKGIFTNVSGIVLTGNEKLCGGIPQLHLALCSNLGSSRKHLSTGVIIAITVTGVIFLALMAGGVILDWRKKPADMSSSTTLLEGEYLRVSYKELLEATNGFAASNLIGMGSFGSVYKGNLHGEDSPVAVKVLNLQKHGASKSFMAECQALRGIRHRNLLKIITSCASVDFRGNDFMALVFEFMPNGSLENWLHEETKSLNLRQRLDMAFDVASALDYLHHHCETPIVHCDLKPSNILLDNDLVAHVGDFGLARLLYGATGNFTNDPSSSSVIKGSIGYVAPEYGMGSKVWQHGDVYSYGILLLEMVTGKRPTDEVFSEGVSLHNFCKIALPERIREIADPFLRAELEQTANINAGNGKSLEDKMFECLVGVAKIGVACSVEQPEGRMNMKNVLKELQIIKAELT